MQQQKKHRWKYKNKHIRRTHMVQRMRTLEKRRDGSTRTTLCNNPDQGRKMRGRAHHWQLKQLPTTGEIQSRQISQSGSNPTHAKHPEIIYGEETAPQTSTQVWYPGDSTVSTSTAQKKISPEHPPRGCIFDDKENTKTQEMTPPTKKTH